MPVRVIIIDINVVNVSNVCYSYRPVVDVAVPVVGIEAVAGNKGPPGIGSVPV